MAVLGGFSTTFLIGCSIVVYLIVHRIYRVFYDLYLHPLAHVPGPKLAAITYLYQSYYSLVGGSRFFVQVGKLHEQYGPVVRITPDEVHLSDPDNYEKIYSVSSKYPKAKPYYETMSCGESSFTTMENEPHRVKRQRLNPFFSKKKIVELEDVVQSNAKKLCDVTAQKLSQGKEMDLHHGYRAVSMDIITDYAFNQCYGFLDREDMGEWFFTMWEQLGPTMWMFQQWPAMMTLANSMPPWMAAATNKPLQAVFQLQAHCQQAIEKVEADIASGNKSAARKTIFHDLLTEDPEQGYIVPPISHLKDEAIAMLGAAADTTGHAMSYATIELTSDPVKYRRLSAELKEAFPDPNAKLDYLTLEKLPYLTGIIKESIRLSHGSPGKLTRVVPKGGATFNGVYVPAGSFVSMGTWELHHNEDYWPDSFKFDPERWEDPEKVRRLDKAFVPFGKGSRMCIGMNLAYCELYVTIAQMFRRFDNLKGNDLTAEDRLINDYISARLPLKAKKFHVSAGPKIG